MKDVHVNGKWSEAFHRSRSAPALFKTAKPYEQAVLKWANEQHVPSCFIGGYRESAFRAWAILDGGITSTERFGFGNGLPSGVRIVGWQTLRVLLSAMGLSPPRGTFLGESTVPDLGALEQMLRLSTTDDAEARDRAEMLAQCGDMRSYQAMIRRLIGDCGLPRNRRPDDVAQGIWGDFHFSQGAAELLDQVIEPADAERVARSFHFRYDESTAEGRQANQVLDEIGYGTTDGDMVLRAVKVGIDIVDEWARHGFLPQLAVRAMEAGADLDTAESWVSLGFDKTAILGPIASGVTQSQVAQYLESGVTPIVLALRLAKLSAPIDEVQSRIAQGESPYHLAYFTAFSTKN